MVADRFRTGSRFYHRPRAPPNSATPIEDGDSYRSGTAGLEGVRSPSSTGVSQSGGVPPSPGRPGDSGPLRLRPAPPKTPAPPPGRPGGETVPSPPRSPDLASPGTPGPPSDLRGRRQWRSHRNIFLSFLPHRRHRVPNPGNRDTHSMRHRPSCVRPPGSSLRAPQSLHGV